MSAEKKINNGERRAESGDTVNDVQITLYTLESVILLKILTWAQANTRLGSFLKPRTDGLHNSTFLQLSCKSPISEEECVNLYLIREALLTNLDTGDC